MKINRRNLLKLLAASVPAVYLPGVMAQTNPVSSSSPTNSAAVSLDEHPRITLRSAIRYFSPKVWDAGEIKRLIADGIFEQFQNASEEVLQKIISGAYQDDTPEPYLKYLQNK